MSILDVFCVNFRLEVASHVICGSIVRNVGLDVCVKYGDSWSNHYWVLRAAHFVIAERQTTTSDGGYDSRQKRHLTFHVLIL